MIENKSCVMSNGNRHIPPLLAGSSIALIISVLCVAARLSIAAPERAKGDPAAPFALVGTAPGSFSLRARSTGSVSVESPFSSDGRLLLLGTDKTGVRVFDCRTLNPVTAFMPHAGLEFAAFVDGSNRIFTAGGKTVCFWDIRSSKLMSSTQVFKDDVIHLAAVAPDGKRYVVQGYARSESALLWRSDDVRQPIARLTHVVGADSIEFRSDGKRIFTTETMQPHRSGDPIVHVWNAETGQEIFKPTVFGQDDLEVWDCADAVLDASGARVLVAEHGGFAIFDCKSGKTLASGKTYSADLRTTVQSICWSPVGDRIIVVGWINLCPANVQVFEASTGKLVRSITSDTWALTPFPDGRWVVCRVGQAGRAKRTQLWDTVSGKLLQEIAGGNWTVAVSPDGEHIAINVDNHVTAVWKRLAEKALPETNSPSTRPNP